MLSRRRFLSYSAAGILSVATGCRPAYSSASSNQKTASTISDSLLENKKTLAGRKNYFLGYPVNMNTPPEAFFNWRNHLQKVGIGDFAFNNVGNPFTDSSVPFNTHDFEKEVILRFGKIYGFSADNIWGFLSHSGTDSNMHGMYMGRTLLKARSGITPKCFFTKETHYSIQILADLLGMEAIFINTLPDASMDAQDLRRKITENSNHPALVVATIGTTFKGAIDSVDQIQNVLKSHESYVHLDAALFGGYLPRTNGIGEVLYKSKYSPKRYDSLAVSCHKFFGFPSPAGLFITTQTNYDHFNEQYSKVHNPEYIGHVPGTITCSRDAVKPAEFYFFSTPVAVAKQARDANMILQHTDYLLDQMKTHLPKLHPFRSSTLSNIIYFKKPGIQVVKKYSLATMKLKLHNAKHDFAHVVIMPHVNKNILFEFLTDIEKDLRFITD